MGGIHWSDAAFRHQRDSHRGWTKREGLIRKMCEFAKRYNNRKSSQTQKQPPSEVVICLGWSQNYCLGSIAPSRFFRPTAPHFSLDSGNPEVLCHKHVA